MTNELLTEDEENLVNALGLCYNRFVRVVGDGGARECDLTEVAGHIHALQNAVLANAAARRYPERYRLLGGGE